MTGRALPVILRPASVALRLEPAPGLDDVAVVGDAIEHGRGHLGVAEHLGPVGEGEVCRHDDRSVFVEVADQVEEQLSFGLAERQVAEFVDAIRSWRRRDSTRRPLRPAAFSCSS